MLTCAQPGLPAACSAETLPGQWHTAHEWQLSQRTAEGRKKMQLIGKIYNTELVLMCFNKGHIYIQFAQKSHWYSRKCLLLFKVP